MHKTFHVPRRGAAAILADTLILPLMRLPFITHQDESPQLTHWWNNFRTKQSDADHLDRSLMVSCSGDPTAKVRLHRWDIRFHLGWWPQYVVLEPTDYLDEWHVGWVAAPGAGASQIPVYGRVRMLIGPDDVAFFGVRATDYRQIRLREVGRGRLRDGGAFRQVPLL